jgi:hypothetical protein
MNDSAELKCACQSCGGHIAFPRAQLRELVACPHCGDKTCLAPDIGARTSPPASLAQISPRAKLAWGVGSALVVLAVVIVGLQLKRAKTAPPSLAQPVAAKTLTVAKAEDFPVVAELNDFKVGPITLKPTEGSSLVHAVGVVRNATDKQRFGVKLALELLDDQDVKLGDTSDYLAVLEPHQDWHFKALVTTPKATKARPVSIIEEN